MSYVLSKLPYRFQVNDKESVLEHYNRERDLICSLQDLQKFVDKWHSVWELELDKWCSDWELENNKIRISQKIFDEFLKARENENYIKEMLERGSGEVFFVSNILIPRSFQFVKYYMNKLGISFNMALVLMYADDNERDSFCAGCDMPLPCVNISLLK